MGSLMSSEIAIRVEGLSKCYEVYELPRDRLKQFFFSGAYHLLGLKRRKFFREFWALKDISFQVKKGDSLGIVGKNGSGKSTLLQILCGILSPSGGTFEVVGRTVALLELGSGFNTEFTGRENIYLNASLLGLSRVEIDSLLNQIINFAEVDLYLDQPLKTYSTGMMLRLAFAVAVHSKPDILVIDEALAVGDELFQRKCFSRINSMRASGVTLILVSHSSGAILEHCSQVLFLDKGDRVTFGIAKDVVSAYHKFIYAGTELSGRIKREFIHRDFLGGSNNAASEVLNDEEFLFDPMLMSQSKVVYSENGALIHSVGIYSLNGEQVNILKSGSDYFFQYSAIFHTESKKVKFGMLLKTVSGFELGGGRATLADLGVDEVIKSGESFTIRFKFSCSLNPGIYFINAGILGLINEEEFFLHRIEDAICFRVPTTENSPVNGVINFGVVPRLTKDV
jgi:lipopolysaccharide transport system ATP-binding protein